MSVTLPTGESNAGKAEWSEVYGNDKALKEAVETLQTEVAAVPTNNSAYRTLLTSGGVPIAKAAAGSYFLAQAITQVSPGTAALHNMVKSGSEYSNATATATATLAGSHGLIYFDDADYTVGSKTQKLRIRAQVAANATKPAIKFTFGLYPVTVAGGANLLVITLGTVVSGSTVEVNEPSASTVTSAVGSDFTIPSDGAYVLGVALSAELTNNNMSLLTAQLQTRHV